MFDDMVVLPYDDDDDDDNNNNNNNNNNQKQKQEGQNLLIDYNNNVRSSIRNIGCLQIFSSLLGSWR
jgi:hypothetical protein